MRIGDPTPGGSAPGWALSAWFAWPRVRAPRGLWLGTGRIEVSPGSGGRELGRQEGGDAVPEPGGGLEVDVHGVDRPRRLDARRGGRARQQRDLGAGTLGQGRLDLG